jgi:dihydroceramidase
MEVNIRPKFKSKERVARSPHPNGGLKDDIRDKEILRTMWTMIAFGLSIFLGGFAIWQLDNIYCSTLIKWRRQIGLPWGILLEGHGWW